MRNLFRVIVLILFITFFTPVVNTEAASGDTYEVSSMVLHVRDEPASNAAIIGLLHKGDQLTAFQEKYGWVQTYYSGETAWIAKHHLISTETVSQVAATVPSSSESITVSDSSVNIRSGPGLDYVVIAGASQGESFPVIEKSGDWTKITLANGTAGWIASWLTTGSEVKSISTVQPASKTTPEQVTNNSLAGYHIVLDAGHGGKDPGAIGLEGIYEKDLVSATTSKIANTLRAYGATVIETRTGDYFLTLGQRVDISNAYQTDAFISVHYNAFPILSVQGMNTYYASDFGRELADSIQSSLASAVPLTNRGIIEENYKVLRNTFAPSILMELGFITNPYDLSVVQTADYQNKVAEAVANGLLDYFH